MGEKLSQSSKLSRREFFKWSGKRVLETTLTASLVDSAVFSTPGLVRKLEVFIQKIEIQKELEQAKPLKVKYFADAILTASNDITKSSTDDERMLAIAGAFAANVGGAYLLKDEPEVIEKTVGTVASIASRVNIGISDITASKYLSDPRLEEYGFRAYFPKKNPLASRDPGPLTVTISNLLTIPLAAYGGWRYPYFGRNYAGASPFLAKTNYEITKVLGLGLEIGDNVKRMIEDGKNKSDIENYLVALRQPQNDDSETNRS